MIPTRTDQVQQQRDADDKNREGRITQAREAAAKESGTPTEKTDKPKKSKSGEE